MVRTHGNDGGTDHNRARFLVWVASVLLVGLLFSPSSIHAAAPAPDDQTSGQGTAATPDERLTRLRELSPEEHPTEYIELGRQVLADLQGTHNAEIEAEVRSGVGTALRVNEQFNEAATESRTAAEICP